MASAPLFLLRTLLECLGKSDKRREERRGNIIRQVCAHHGAQPIELFRDERRDILLEYIPIDHLDVFAAEINAESRELAEKNGNTTVTYGGYIWPCSSKYVTSPLGARYTGIAGASRNHAGIDIGRVGYTTQAVAAKAGTVIISAYNKYRGNYVVVSHGSGNTTTYQHLSSRSVSGGTHVAQGQVVGIDRREQRPAPAL